MLFNRFGKQQNQQASVVLIADVSINLLQLIYAAD